MLADVVQQRGLWATVSWHCAGTEDGWKPGTGEGQHTSARVTIPCSLTSRNIHTKPLL